MADKNTDQMTDAEKFFTYDYGETKDLLKNFINLISATLVVSVTFADKVIPFGSAPEGTKKTLFISWLLLILALGLAGLSLILIAAAAGKILYNQLPILDLDYWTLAVYSWFFGILAGSSYVGALVALVIAAGDQFGPSIGHVGAQPRT